MNFCRRRIAHVRAASMDGNNVDPEGPIAVSLSVISISGQTGSAVLDQSITGFVSQSGHLLAG